MKISIVTPCLNAQDTIDRTLKSLQVQEYPQLEYIVRDGGSTDGTLDVIARYPDLVTDVLTEKDRNVAEAVNKGFRAASGDIHAYLNADDCLTAGTLAFIAETFATNPSVDVITGGCCRVFADGSQVQTQVPDRYLRSMSLRNDIEQPSTFWRSSIHKRAGPFDESYHLAFDWEWWNRLVSIGATFMKVDRVLSVYYFSETNLTSRAGLRGIDEMYRVTKTYGPYKGLAADIYWFLFKLFDMHGYYDVPFHELSPRKQRVFGTALRWLCRLFGEEVIHNYNWNWACKQVRGVKWY